MIGPSHARKPRIVVITGASAGIGRASVRAFADRGDHLGLIARGVDGLEGARREVEQRGGRAVVVPCDVADADAVEAAASEIESRLGPIDVWVNNAMVSVFSKFEEMKAEEFKRVIEVSFLGVVYGTMSALKRMRPRDRGKIIQIGSALAYRGIPLQSAYCSAKHAIQGLCDSIRAELIHDGSNVKLTMIQFPAINTPQFDWIKSRLPRKGQPVPPIFQPETAAEAILWCADHDRRELFLGWPTYEAILGNKLVPGFGDRYVARNAWDSQMRDEPEDPDRPHNLWEPLPGDWGAHGSFDDRARPRRWQLALTIHRDAILLGGLAIAGVLAARAGLSNFDREG